MAKPLNLLHIMADQLNASALAAYGNKVALSLVAQRLFLSLRANPT